MTHVDQRPENLVVLEGDVAAEPLDRELPDGGTVVQFDLRTTVHRDGVSLSRPVPIAWHDPSPRDRALLTPSTRLVVVGSVERRFFRVGGSTQSRTEVIAMRVVPTRRKKALSDLVDDVLEQLSRAGGSRDPSAASA